MSYWNFLHAPNAAIAQDADIGGDLSGSNIGNIFIKDYKIIRHFLG